MIFIIYIEGDVVGPILSELLKLWRSIRRESKGYEVQEVSNFKRWTGMPNNDSGEKAQCFAGGVQQNKRTYIGVLQRAQEYQKIESVK